MQLQRTNDKAVGGVLAAGAAVALVMVLHHPAASGSNAVERIQDIAAKVAPDAWVHGVLATTSAAIAAGLLWFVARLGPARRPHLWLAAVAIGLSAVFTCLAVMLDGFVTPALARSWTQADPTGAAALPVVLRAVAAQIEILTRFSFFATAAAAAVLSADLASRPGLSRLVAAVGAVCALAQFWTLFATAARLSPHNLPIFVAAQAGWYLTAAAAMGLGVGPFACSAGKG